MFRSLNASRASISRAMTRQSLVPKSRTFLATPSRQADLIQELYVKAINSHKSTPVKATDSEGQVRKFKVPATPMSPEESNIAGELKSYEDQVVEVEGASTTGEAPVEENWFEDPEEEEIPHDKAH